MLLPQKIMWLMCLLGNKKIELPNGKNVQDTEMQKKIRWLDLKRTCDFPNLTVI